MWIWLPAALKSSLTDVRRQTECCSPQPQSRPNSHERSHHNWQFGRFPQARLMEKMPESGYFDPTTSLDCDETCSPRTQAVYACRRRFATAPSDTRHQSARICAIILSFCKNVHQIENQSRLKMIQSAQKKTGAVPLWMTSVPGPGLQTRFCLREAAGTALIFAPVPFLRPL